MGRPRLMLPWRFLAMCATVAIVGGANSVDESVVPSEETKVDRGVVSGLDLREADGASGVSWKLLVSGPKAIIATSTAILCQGWKDKGFCKTRDDVKKNCALSCAQKKRAAIKGLAGMQHTLSIGTVDPGERCKFPFKYAGKWHRSCIGAGQKPPFPVSVNFLGQKLHRGWCSTTSKWQGKWGACGACKPGLYNWPKCNRRCHRTCQTCDSPEGALRKGHLQPKFSWLKKAAKGPADRYGGAHFCTSCKPKSLLKISTVQYSAPTSLSKLGGHSGSTQHHFDYFVCGARGKGKYLLASEMNMRQMKEQQAQLLKHATLPPLWRLFVKVEHNPIYQMIASNYQTQSKAGQNYNVAFVVHHGENWFAKCLVEKRVRCKLTRNMKMAGKCLVSKKTVCASVKTVRAGECCGRHTKGRCPRHVSKQCGPAKNLQISTTFGKWPAAGGRVTQLPGIDTNCYPRPPLFKKKEDWCRNAVILL